MVLLLVLSVFAAGKEISYDPASKDGEFETELTEFRYTDREVPLKVYLPEKKPAPVILLSHGLGGSREVGTYLGEYWAARGYVVVAMQHAGSDESVWKDVPRARRLAAAKEAANGETFLDRMRDVPATLDQLEKWNAQKGHFLKGRMDLEHIGMAGHSYGAVTTQAVCGQVFGIAGAKFADSRIDAGLALSPSPPNFGDAAKAFGQITLPMMLMTGTEDRSVVGRTTPESRREVYPALPDGSKYELVLKDAEHMAFSDRTLRGAEQRNPEHHKVILALSTAFWDAYLKEDPAARKWLDGKTPSSILAEDDIWQRK
ncbi:dienelactone hydrolase protein [Haloferula helveola]|uniref:Dienelactone hydrolase protein n=2 Tax=Haloferula helveola TaxID=490095 RepID=A0ABM7R9L0_9BACT|nr:dienelactone hydrolase protein [Haloferula helveola]